MSRPDALHWRNTNHLESMEFSPGRLIYNRVPKWISSMLVLQLALGAAIWVAVRSNPVKAWLTAKVGERWTAAIVQGRAAVEGSRFDWFAGFVTPEEIGLALSLVVSLGLSTLLVQLVAMPLVRHRLQGHTSGLKEVFDAIRSMGTGVVPKPITAGRPGESGFLALAFNDMMAKLLANRKELQEANLTLERKVDARTQELRDAAMKMEKMALLDALTGLSNRRALMEQGEDKFSAAVREGADLICMMIDLDNFKGVNDTLGHAKGDELIRLAADTLRRCCRPCDVSARLGGDEFVLILGLEDIAQATAIADRLQREFEGKVDEFLKGFAVPKRPSMSIGITSRKSAAAQTFNELMAHTDAALYRAKAKGKACAEVYLKGAA